MEKRTAISLILVALVVGFITGHYLIPSVSHQQEVVVVNSPDARTPTDVQATVENETAIADMKVGDRGYTVPWGLELDRDGSCWVNPNYTVDPDPGGTLTVLIERTSEGYVVTDKGTDRKIETSNESHPNSWASLKAAKIIRV